MAERQRGSQEQNTISNGNGEENVPQDEFMAANSLVRQEQETQLIPESKRFEVQEQDGTSMA